MNYGSREWVDLHVIDALDAASLRDYGSDADMLTVALQGTSINIVSHTANDLSSFKSAISAIVDFRGAYIAPRKATPYVHISCHGRTDALVLGAGVEVPWAVLSEVLLPLAEKTDYHFPLSLSSCWGYRGAELAYVMIDGYLKRRPYYTLVGPTKPANIRPLCAAFSRSIAISSSSSGDLDRSVELANEGQSVKLDFTRGVRVSCTNSNPKTSL